MFKVWNGKWKIGRNKSTFTVKVNEFWNANDFNSHLDGCMLTISKVSFKTFYASRFDKISFDLIWFDLTWLEFWFDLFRFVSIWLEFWFDLIRFDSIWFDSIQFNSIWLNLSRFDSIWFEFWFDLTWILIQFDLIWFQDLLTTRNL